MCESISLNLVGLSRVLLDLRVRVLSVFVLLDLVLLDLLFVIVDLVVSGLLNLVSDLSLRAVAARDARRGAA